MKLYIAEWLSFQGYFKTSKQNTLNIVYRCRVKIYRRFKCKIEQIYLTVRREISLNI